MRDPRLGTDHRGFQIQGHGAGATVTDFNPKEVHDGCFKIPKPSRRTNAVSFSKTATLTSPAVRKSMVELTFDRFCGFR
jgi:hypothetical protein